MNQFLRYLMCILAIYETFGFYPLGNKFSPTESLADYTYNELTYQMDYGDLIPVDEYQLLDLTNYQN